MKTLVIIDGVYGNIGKSALFFNDRAQALKYIEEFEDIAGYTLKKSNGDHWRLIPELDEKCYIDIEIRDTENTLKYAVTYHGELPDNIKAPTVTDDFARFNSFNEAYEYAVNFLVKNHIDPKPGENKKCSWLLKDEKNDKCFLSICIRENPDSSKESTYNTRDLHKLVSKYCKDYIAAYKEGKKTAIINIVIGVIGVLIAFGIILWGLLTKNYGVFGIFIYTFLIWLLPISCLANGFEAITKGYVKQEIIEDDARK